MKIVLNIGALLKEENKLFAVEFFSGSKHMRIYNSIRTAVLSGITQLLNFPAGPRVIMRMCNDPETGACLQDGLDSSPE